MVKRFVEISARVLWTVDLHAVSPMGPSFRENSGFWTQSNAKQSAYGRSYRLFCPSGCRFCCLMLLRCE